MCPLNNIHMQKYVQGTSISQTLHLRHIHTSLKIIIWNAHLNLLRVFEYGINNHDIWVGLEHRIQHKRFDL